MATAREARSPTERAATETHRRRVTEEVGEQVQRDAARRRTQGSRWEVVGGEKGLYLYQS